MTDPAFRARLRVTALDAMLPDWAPRAACAEKAPNNSPWSPMFDDDVSHRPDGDYTWPAKVRHAIAVCQGCPVRIECLTYAIESEHRMEQAYWAADLEDQRDGRRYGVFGGVPGRIRERFRSHRDPVHACDTWFQANYSVDCATGEFTRTETI